MTGDQAAMSYTRRPIRSASRHTRRLLSLISRFFSAGPPMRLAVSLPARHWLRSPLASSSAFAFSRLELDFRLRHFLGTRDQSEQKEKKKKKTRIRHERSRLSDFLFAE